MIDWFSLAIISAVAFGVHGFLLKYVVQKKLERYSFLFVLNFVGAIVLFVYLRIKGTPIDFSPFLIFLGVLSGLFFVARASARLVGLNCLPINLLYPMISLNVGLIVIVSILFLGETLTWLQSLGILLAFIVILLFNTEKKSMHGITNFKLGVLMAIIYIIFSIGGNVISKIGATSGSMDSFILLGWIFSTVFAGIAAIGKRGINLQTIKWGGLLGITNLLVFYTYVLALSVGPLSQVMPILSLNVLVASILAWMFHKEHFSIKRIVLVGLSIVAVILLGI